MIMTGERASTGIKPCPSTALSTRNPSRAGPVLNTVLHRHRPTCNSRSYAWSVERGRRVVLVSSKDEVLQLSGGGE